jgi:protocatechuate 3,4-dioxygenase beta subunit
MERKDFLKNGFLAALGLVAIAPLGSCKKDDTLTDTSAGSGSGSSAGDCAVSPTETAGPFPTKSPSSLVTNDIRNDRTGVPFTIKITVNNKNSNCAALAGAIVDIWHCDKDGYYSEYGGAGMQSANFTSVHFLRGRQVTDANGLVQFTSIFPGWYSGRAPHIHVHIYDASGRSLLVTQIAFPTDVCDTVYTTATQYYTRGKQDTTNARDNVFADSLASELATVTGSVSAGYSLTHLITVAA